MTISEELRLCAAQIVAAANSADYDAAPEIQALLAEARRAAFMEAAEMVQKMSDQSPIGSHVLTEAADMLRREGGK